MYMYVVFEWDCYAKKFSYVFVVLLLLQYGVDITWSHLLGMAVPGTVKGVGGVIEAMQKKCGNDGMIDTYKWWVS